MREGKYWGVIKSAITTKSPKKGTPEIAITVTVTHELDGIEWAPIDNIDRVVHLYLSDGAWDRSKETLESLGFNGDFGSPEFKDETTTSGLALYMSLGEYEGKPRENWKIDNGGYVPEELPSESLLQLKARWKAGSKSAPKPAKPPAAAKPTAKAPESSEAKEPSPF